MQEQKQEGNITQMFLKKLLRSDFKTYYSTPHLNDCLYLHFKGFKKITNLQPFIGLKVLYLQGNIIKRIQGLQTLINLRSLYLNENIISKIEGLGTLHQLVNLNLSDNMIEKIQGLEGLSKLSNLQLKRNRIDSVQNSLGLLECPNVSALDLSDNKVDDQRILEEVLMKMKNIAVIYLQNNGFNKKISHYRKKLIISIPTLKYIDDKPIFEDQRRCALAWQRGGLEEQRAERERYRQEKEQQHWRQHEEFRSMMQRYREQNTKSEEYESSENQSDSKSQSLETYKSPQYEHSDCTSKQSDSESGKQNKLGEQFKEQHQQRDNENKLIQNNVPYLDELD